MHIKINNTEYSGWCREEEEVSCVQPAFFNAHSLSVGAEGSTWRAEHLQVRVDPQGAELTPPTPPSELTWSSVMLLLVLRYEVSTLLPSAG